MSLQRQVIHALHTHPYMDKGLPVMVTVEYRASVCDGAVLSVQGDTVTLNGRWAEHVVDFESAVRIVIRAEQRGKAPAVYARTD